MLKHPERVEAKSVEELKKLSLQHPYSQPIQLLYAFRLNKGSEYLFNRQLGKTSILTDDRSILFDLFEREAEESVSQNLSLTPVTEMAEIKPEAVEPEEEVREEVQQPHSERLEEVQENSDEQKEGKLEKPIKNKFDHLPPAERVKAILEENRRLRREFELKKSGQKLEDEGELISTPDEKNNELTIDPLTEAAAEVDPEVEEHADTTFEIDQAEGKQDAPDEGQESSSIEIKEGKIFAIGEEVEEPVFEIEEDSSNQTSEEVIPDIGEAHSFSDWLQRLRRKAGELEEKPQSVNPLEEKISLLDSFVEKLPQLKKKSRTLPKSSSSSSINVGSMTDDREEGSMVTETLARVYIKQGHYDKAIKAYEIMKLKYPEKSSFFADQISEIKNLINSK